jgi:hypothetical protein
VPKAEQPAAATLVRSIFAQADVAAAAHLGSFSRGWGFDVTLGSVWFV